MESVGLVGGTFEFFHIGHQKLIETGLSYCDNLEIWVISDEIAQQKDPRISSWKERCDYIQSNLLLEEVKYFKNHISLRKFASESLGMTIPASDKNIYLDRSLVR